MRPSWIEHHPDNGSVPYVVRIRLDDGSLLWFAYPTPQAADEAELRLLELCEEAELLTLPPVPDLKALLR